MTTDYEIKGGSPAELREVAQRLRSMDLCAAHTPREHFETLTRAAYFLEAVALRAERACPPQTGTAPPLLPDTFVERAIRMALAQPEFKLEGDTVVGLSAFEAAFIREKYTERNRVSPPQPEIPQT